MTINGVATPLAVTGFAGRMSISRREMRKCAFNFYIIIHLVFELVKINLLFFLDIALSICYYI